MKDKIQSMISEIKNLQALNATITKNGGFFTPEQIANEKKAWQIKMALRFEHGVEIGSY